MKEFLMTKLKQKAVVALVGGSDRMKMQEQMGGDDVTQLYDYVFSENGLDAYKDGKPLSRMSIKKAMGEENIKTLVNFCLRYIADLDIPKKRSTIEYFRDHSILCSPLQPTQCCGAVYSCILLYIPVYLCTPVHSCTFLYTRVYSCTFLYTFIYFYTLLYTRVLSHTPLYTLYITVHSHTPSSTPVLLPVEQCTV
jgi:hypothetical protein